ncbi:cellulase family glycosylhydrolase [Saccharicrinis sp. GN24d3]|uniref:cellulase family glycosylhydrolase n=1 Tax=Saccharicrinis sp. GN24d3 TaxID=3458416 RepID=UPI0040360FA8
MKKILLLVILVISTFELSAQLKHALRDAHGRHVIGRGFVVVTNNTFFSEDDYTRMVRLGANYQVVRLELGKLGDFPGASLDPNYLLKLDTLVQLGANAGMNTVFKMTVYGVKEFSWEKFWVNEDKVHEKYLDAWKVVWNRYKNISAVVGYDIVNEPRKLAMDISYDDLTNQYLIPYYQRLIDTSQKINPDKYCLVQSIFMNKGEAINGNQYAEFSSPIKRKKILFAPHIYQNQKELVKPTLLRFEKESKILKAPVFIGEWGFPTFSRTDSTMSGRLGQLNYMDFYIRTAELFDSLGINTIKAWFSGNPRMQNFLPGGPSTWAIFTDKHAVGTAERKYITDIIARPYPQSIAGDIQSFKYDFATRSLDVFIKSDNSKGVSKIFVGANRHYPDGFTVVINDSFILCHNPLKTTGLDVVKMDIGSNPADVCWNSARQQLMIQKWPVDNNDVHLRIIPGVKDYKE